MAATQQHIVHIKPFEGAKIFGDAKFFGKLKDAKGEVHDYKKRPFVINGNGMILDISKPEEKKVYDLILGPNVKQVLNKNSGSLYRFDIVDIAKEADDYLAGEDMRTDYKGQIKKMGELQLRTIGMFFKVSGGEKVVRAALYRMIDDPKTCAAIGKFLNHPDRVLLEYIYSALQDGDKANKKGLYKDERDYYYFNESSIALGTDGVVAYLKKDTQDSITIYNLLKELYEQKFKTLKK